MNFEELYLFTVRPRRCPYYLFNKLFAQRSMEMQKHERVESEEDANAARKVSPILPSTSWRKFQTYKHLESWGKDISEEFPENGLNLDHSGDVLPSYRNGLRGAGRRLR